MNKPQKKLGRQLACFMKKVITQKCVSPKLHGLFCDHPQPSSHSPINQQAQQLRIRSQMHEKYCLMLLDLQVRKHAQYIQQILNLIYNEIQDNVTFFQQRKKDIQGQFQNYRNNLQVRKKQLKFNSRFRTMDNQQKVAYLRTDYLQLQMFQVHLPDLHQFKRDIQKYLVRRIDIKASQNEQASPFNEEHRQDKHMGSSREERYMGSSRQEKLMYNSRQQRTINNGEYQQQVAVDDGLCCDQDLSMQVSAQSMRRKKYALRRQQIIQEEDQSQESSSVVSDC